MTSDFLSTLREVRRELHSRPQRQVEGAGAQAWTRLSEIVHDQARWVRNSLHSPGLVDSSELAQQALVALQSVELVDRIIESRHPFAYLRGTMRHMALDVLRRRWFEVQPIGDLAGVTTDVDESEVPDSAQVVRLRVALDGLPWRDKHLLYQRFWLDLAIAEIARNEGLSYSATAVRLFRLLRRLERELVK